MRALVTGATGFLGSHLVQCLRAGGHAVRAMVRNPQKAHVLDGMDAELVPGDITAPSSLESAVQGVDVVFHAAALVSGWEPWSTYRATTVQGTENLFTAAAQASVKRFVHISTVRVYDDRHCSQHGVATEEAPHGIRGFRPFGQYAHAKVLAEAAVWRHANRLPVTVIRPAWIYGPRDEVILPPLIRFLRDPLAFWPGSSDPCADPIYVTDVADCAIAAALHPGSVHQAYNAAPHQRIRVREFLGPLCDVLGIRMLNRSMPYFLANGFAHFWEWCWFLTRRRTVPPVTRAALAMLTADVRHDPGKAERELGWRSRVDLSVGIEQTARWLKLSHAELFR